MKRHKQTSYFLSILCLGLFCLSCTEQWNAHYDGKATYAEDNLWQTIQQQADLSEFSHILMQTGYDKVLTSTQMFTVWAPTNGTFSVEGMDTKRLLDEFVQNHVCRSVQAIPDNADTLFNHSIQTLNGKRIRFRQSIEKDAAFFGEASLLKRNMLCHNGVLHTLEGKAVFFDNIWEYLPKDSTLSMLNDYLHSFDTLYFDAEASTEGGIVNGEIVYLDSVIYNDNPMLNKLGRIDKENGDYLFLAPTNNAWEEAYQRILPYYDYGPIDGAEGYQDKYVKASLVNNTVFGGYKTQVSPGDSLVSTRGRAFYDVERLMRGAVEIKMSNGYLYKVDTLGILPEESWFLPIKVEAENSGYREAQYCSIENRDAKSSSFRVSGGSYVEVSPSSTSNATAVYTVHNTLSAKYDIYCVFVPQRISNPNLKRVLPTKVRFQLLYMNKSGQQATINLGTATVDTEKMDTVLVRKGFVFPIANYGLDNMNVQFKIINNVSNKETANFNRKMFIDCFYFQPAE